VKDNRIDEAFVQDFDYLEFKEIQFLPVYLP